MISHPPVLFLGYSSLIIPFAYAVSGLWHRQYTEWIKPALPWTIFGILSLGAGLLLGAVWAYESLPFGGFWSWDPVENASLVPWLTLVAALHMMIIARKYNYSYLATFFLTTVPYVFVLYASFLTKSGILSDSSVHAFVSDGKSVHLISFLLTFIFLAVILIILNRKRFPEKQNEFIWSREFWMFIGVIILFISAFQIIFNTSAPLFNKLFNTNIAPPINRIDYYNNWQMPFAILITLFVGIAYYFQYGKNNLPGFYKKVLFPFILSVVLTALSAWIFNISKAAYIIMLFASVFSIISSLDNIIRRNCNYAAGITHLGFGVFMLGVLIAFSTKQIISENTSKYSLAQNIDNQENLLLVKNDILPMGDYYVSYSGNTRKGSKIFYQVDFLKKDNENYFLLFSLHPAIQVNKRMGNVYEPAKKHLISKDVYTYITYADVSEDASDEGYKILKETEIRLKDTLFIGDNKLVLDSISVDNKSVGDNFDHVIITAKTIVVDKKGKHYYANPKYIINKNVASFEDSSIDEFGLKLSFVKVSDTPNTIVLRISERKTDYIVIKTLLYPFINILWAGVVIMMIGLFIAVCRKFKQSTLIL